MLSVIIIIFVMLFIALLLTELLLYAARERCYYHNLDLTLIQEQYQDLVEAKRQREKRRSMRP